jgi:hypothetical protein
VHIFRETKQEIKFEVHKSDLRCAKGVGCLFGVQEKSKGFSWGLSCSQGAL